MNDLDRLAELARAATRPEWRGPWTVDHSDRSGRPIVRDGSGLRIIGSCVRSVDDGDHLAAYIASASPDVILALVEKVKRYEAAIDTVLSDEETGAGGWGPDVTMASILRLAREGS